MGVGKVSVFAFGLILEITDLQEGEAVHQDMVRERLPAVHQVLTLYRWNKKLEFCLQYELFMNE